MWATPAGRLEAPNCATLIQATLAIYRPAEVWKRRLGGLRRAFFFMSWTFRQRQKIVRLQSVILSLDVLVTVVGSDDHFNALTTLVDEELFASLNFGNARRLGDLKRNP
jgi:hypothetical protein